MASYTMTLRECIQTLLSFRGVKYDHLPTKDFIELGRKELFDFDYPIFNEEYKSVFETNFIRKFYMREIGFEVEELFQFQLETWLQINMPYFNKMFESELLEYDPLTNSKMEMTYEKNHDKNQNDNSSSVGNMSSVGSESNESNQKSSENGSHSETSNGQKIDDNFNRNINSDNPDSRLALTTNDGEGVIEYASSIEENNANNKQTTNDDVSGTSKNDVNVDGTSTTTSNVDNESSKNDTLDSKITEAEEFVQHRLGKIGVVSYPKLIMEYRSALLRVEKQIHDEMQELFMLVY